MDFMSNALTTRPQQLVKFYSLLQGLIFLLSKPIKLILLVSLHKEVCIKTNEVVLLKPMVRMKFK